MKVLVLIFVLLATAALAAPAHGQEEEAFVYVNLRVSSTTAANDIVVDRGANDLVEVGDLVVFHPRAGGTFTGSVIKVDERSATVRLQDEGFLLALGTSGNVLLPAARVSLAAGAARVGASDEPGVGEGLEHPPWENEEHEWDEDLPLLTQVQAVRPEFRAPLVSGRLYAIGDHRFRNHDGRSDFFYRTGADLLYENPFGRGGGLRLDGEANYRMTDVPGQVDESEGRLRLDRLSYYRGGTRFDSKRHEWGRFLQDGMPEFGVVDGYEMGRRRRNGDRYGVSVGFMPEPDGKMSTGDDFQLAAYYRWIFDPEERFSISSGFQKTFHNGASDRDLFVATTRYLPVDGWDFHGSAWVDFYTSGDDAKDTPIDLTQFLVSTSRQWDSGNGLTAAFRHNRFPALDRFEFTPVNADQLANDRYERLSLRGWRWSGERKRWYGEAGVWSDQDDTGGDAELGVDVRDLFLADSQADFTLFGARGAFSVVAGGRVSYGRYSRNGRWDVLYELAAHRADGFADDTDDFLQHRLRATRDFYLRSNWNLSLYAESLDWDQDPSLSVGFYLEKSF